MTMVQTLNVLGGLLVVVGLLTLLPVVVLALQVALAITAPRRSPAASQSNASRARIAILMPAHNEALGIGEPLRSAMAQLQGADRVLVVADNCSDDTAAVARSSRRRSGRAQRPEPPRQGLSRSTSACATLAADPPEVVITRCRLPARARGRSSGWRSAAGSRGRPCRRCT